MDGPNSEVKLFVFLQQQLSGLKYFPRLQDEPQILGTTNGTIGNRKLFNCHKNHGKFVPMSDLVKEEDFFNIITGINQIDFIIPAIYVLSRSAKRCTKYEQMQLQI